MKMRESAWKDLGLGELMRRGPEGEDKGKNGGSWGGFTGGRGSKSLPR